MLLSILSITMIFFSRGTFSLKSLYWNEVTTWGLWGETWKGSGLWDQLFLHPNKCQLHFLLVFEILGVIFGSFLFLIQLSISQEILLALSSKYESFSSLSLPLSWLGPPSSLN